MSLRLAPLLIFCAAVVGPPARAGERSVTVPPGAADPVVKVCETATRYEFRIAGSDYSYDKDEYRAALRAELGGLLAAEDVAVDAGTIAVWIAVPEASPGATQARAVVRTEQGELVAFLSLHPSEWHLTRRDAAVLLGDDEYPDSYGVRAGELLLKADAGASQQQIRALVERHGGTLVEGASSGLWHTVRTRLFDEARVRAGALGDAAAKGVVTALYYNDVVEWIARREPAFDVPLSGGNP